MLFASLNFAVVRFFMKLFKTVNIDVIIVCRWYFAIFYSHRFQL